MKWLAAVYGGWKTQIFDIVGLPINRKISFDSISAVCGFFASKNSRYTELLQSFKALCRSFKAL